MLPPGTPEPTSSVIAFTMMNPDGRSDLYWISPDGTHQQNVSQDVEALQSIAGFVNPEWSPDGLRIAFVGLDQNNDPAGIFAVSRVDGTVSNLLKDPGVLQGVRSFSKLKWSPDGSKIAFSGGKRVPDGGQIDRVWILDVQTGILVGSEKTDGWERNPDWSPDGAQVVFASLRDDFWDLYLMAADGTGPRRLTNQQAADKPDWSPDGKWIVFESYAAGPTEVYMISLDTQRVSRITSTGGHGGSGQPIWSPDGTQFAYTSTGSSGGTVDKIFIATADGGEQRQLVVDSGYVTPPSWSPDGRSITFKGQDGVYVASIDGSEKPRLIQAGGDSPAWSPSPKEP